MGGGDRDNSQFGKLPRPVAKTPKVAEIRENTPRERISSSDAQHREPSKRSFPALDTSLWDKTYSSNRGDGAGGVALAPGLAFNKFRASPERERGSSSSGVRFGLKAGSIASAFFRHATIARVGV